MTLVLGARDKRALGNQVRGLLRPFGIRLASRQGTKAGRTDVFAPDIQEIERGAGLLQSPPAS